jgi:hypothetical protein
MKKYYILFISLLCIISIYLIEFKNTKQDIKNNSLIAYYVDDVKQSELPSKSNGYSVDKVVCDNNATGTWNNTDWNITISNISTDKTKCSVYFINLKDKAYSFDYTGSEQTFTIPYDGYYKFEAWGAQGGTYSFIGANGGYVLGTINLSKESIVHIYVGSQSTGPAGGYNGGGSTYTIGGGGATDFRLNSNDLYSRIMVAAGGGASQNVSYSYGSYSGYGGVGGGLHGGNGSIGSAGASTCGSGWYTTGGTQVSGGYCNTQGTETSGTFGVGASKPNNQTYNGGGGGYYGGGTMNCGVGGGGGSSYISGYKGCVAISSSTSLTPRNDASGTQCTETSAASDITCSYHYSGKVFTNAEMIAGNASMPTHDGTSTMTGNSGNGYAKITYLGSSIN